MEKYRESLKKRQQVYGFTAAMIPVFTLLVRVWTNRLAISPGNGHLADFMHGMSVGLLCMIILVLAKGMFSARKALKDEVALKKLYIAETDERTVFLRNKMGVVGVRGAVFLLLFASVIASFFHAVVSFTLAIAAAGISFVFLVVKIYYKAKY